MKKTLILSVFLCLFSSPVFSQTPNDEVLSPGEAKQQTVCLNMIVKNESKVIRRCLESIKPLIDYWVIIDTGSTDNTREIIRQTMQGVPGELHERLWENFEVNRNQALELAKGKGNYLLFIDADETFVYDKNFQLRQLDKDFYYFRIQNESNGRIFSEYRRILLVKDHLNWRWKGVVHEEIYSSEAKTCELMEEITNLSKSEEGARSQDPQKYLKDAAVLEKALKDHPDDPRYLFFLAVSYMNAGDHLLALNNFQKRIAVEPNRQMSGEITLSLYFIGCIRKVLGMDFKEVVDSFTVAYLYNSSRAEPLHELGCYLIDQKNYLLADLVLQKASTIPQPQECFQCYVQSWVYEWGVLYKLAECFYKMGRFSESKELIAKLLIKPLPESIREQLTKNLEIINQMKLQ